MLAGRQMARRARDAVLGLKMSQFAPPGHFYSPVSTAGDRQRALSPWPLVGVEFRDDAQDEYLVSMPAAWTSPAWRLYRPDNSMFAAGDAAFLAAILRRERPARVLEVGSGWSTAAMVDVKHTDLPDLQITCVEPFVERLHHALGPALGDVTVRQEPVQDTPWETFAQLQRGDVLFVDSTHVVKPGSDVNRIVLDVMPRLPVGVLVHVHDVFDGFELPPAWLAEGRDWSEAYLLRAFLTGNRDWQLVAFTARLWGRHGWLRDSFPKGTLGPDGVWLRRVNRT